MLASKQRLKHHKIIKDLPTVIADSISLHIAEKVTSTNDAIQAIPKATHKTTILCAEQQTQARGRRGRSWHNKLGSSICMSIRIQTSNNIQELYGLNIVTAISIAQAINSIKNTEVKVKWPNDIIILKANNYYKIGGVLTELISSANANYDVIIGIGLNNNDVGKPAANTALPVNIASLQDLYNKEIDRNIVVSKLISHICNNLDKFFTNNLQSFMNIWKHFDAFYQKKVSVITEKKTLAGVALGINNKGGIIVDIKGKPQQFYAADVSLRLL